MLAPYEQNANSAKQNVVTCVRPTSEEHVNKTGTTQEEHMIDIGNNDA